MLKKLSKLFLGLVVCAGSACVTPTHASSAEQVVLVHIQAASPHSAKEEFISIYNNTPNPVDITGWCLTNKSNISFSCFTPAGPELSYSLPGYGFAVVASEQFEAAHEFLPEVYTQVFPITNQSSGSIVNSADSISLVNKDKDVIDLYSWTSALPSGKVAARHQSITTPNTYDTLDPILSWSYILLGEIPVSSVEIIEVEVPLEPELPEEELPLEIEPIEHPILTELFPNPSGSDTGREFIELFNPSKTEVLYLDTYTLKVGKNLEKSYAFPQGLVLQPLSYRAFYSTEIAFTLLNTNSKVQLSFEGQAIGEVVEYLEPKDDASWSLLGVTSGASWQYAFPTPHSQNKALVSEAEDTAETSTGSTLKPCAVNQYRSPETNRCRLIATATTTLKACSPGQYRHPETNRCRNSTSSQSTLTACKVGQERNPETNRCRNIVSMTNAGHAVKGEAVEANVGVSWYWWLGVGGIVMAISTYALWEWRVELQKVIGSVRAKVARMKH